ncbi:MAG: glycosyltransferase family 2 protein [Janthinobacterium lividum]
MTPTVDVIIPAYNISRHLPTALESVINQTFQNWRIFVVDDGSSDGTEEVLRPFQDRLGARLVYTKQQNQGPSAARNTGIRQGSAGYIALLDGDDLWVPERLADSVDRLERTPAAGLSYGLVTRISETGGVIDTWRGNETPVEGKLASDVYMRRVEFPCPTITIRRTCLEEVGLFDEQMRATEDRDLWLRIAQIREVAFIPKVLAFYRTAASSASLNYEKMMNAQLHFVAKHFGEPGCGPKERQAAMARIYRQRAQGFKAEKQPWKAFVTSSRALATYPRDKDTMRTTVSLALNLLKTQRGG